MHPLFDLLANSQGGNGMEALAQRFGLSPQQAQAAVEALMPAFSQGLKQNTADPYGLGAFMTAMASGQHAKYFEDPANAFSPSGTNEGNGILGHLFGSKELSRAVADQAAQATGIGQDVLKQMLPVLASMLMGGLFKQSTDSLRAGGVGGGNPLGEIIEQMMRQGGAATGATSPRQSPQPGGPANNPLGQILEGMFSGGARREGQAQPSQPDNPLGRIFEEMLGGNRTRHTPQDQANPGPASENPPQNPYDDLFGKMFETGASQRDEYQKGVESIFEQFTRGMDKRR